MAPRKTKVSKETPSLVSDTPIVFFLKIGDEETEHHVAPAGDATSYSDILSSVEVTQDTNRFNTDLLKSVLEKVTSESYNAQTVCFWCCHGFSWARCVLPRSYDAYKNMYTAEGNFCSPECALAFGYADTRTSDSVKWSQHAILGTLYADLYKERMLSPAPPRTLLRMFGGPLDIAQYREYTCGENHIVHSELHPIRLVFPSMNVQGPLRDIKKYVSLSNETVEKASEQLRLKRSKPLNTNVPTLDMCIKKKGI
jgi:hypothetical protein